MHFIPEFAQHVKEKLIAKLNPLDRVQLQFEDSKGGFSTRYLEFKFSRVQKKGVTTHLLITVNDITRRIQLEEELEASQHRAQGEMELLLQLMHVQPTVLGEFLTNALEKLQRLNAELRRPATELIKLQNKAEVAYRILHALKGDASAINIGILVENIHETENLLVQLKNNSGLSGNDFLPVTVRLERLFTQVETMQTLVNRMTQFGGVVVVDQPKHAYGHTDQAQQAIVSTWKEFATQLAQRHNKQVEINYQGETLESLPANYRQAISTITHQFIRNTLVHGLELPSVRKQHGKSAVGQIAIYLSQRVDGGYDYSFRDDGQGLALDKIKQRALAAGLLTEDQSQINDMRRLAMLIFSPGFSTRQDADQDSGRGMGLDVIKSLVADLGGQIRIGSTPGEYCHFRVALPAPTRAQRVLEADDAQPRELAA